MKKIIFCILLCFYMTGVEALEYTEYSKFGDYTDEVIKSDDLTDVKVERRYKFYKLNKMMGPYLKEENNEYSYLDKEDYIYSEYSDYSLDRPKDESLREIEEGMINHYKMAGPIDYVELTATSGDVYLDNFMFLDNGETVDYEITNMENTLPVIKSGGTISFKLQKKVQLANLEIRIKGLGNASATYSFEVDLGSKEKIYQKMFSTIPGNSGAVLYGNGFRPIDYDDYYSPEELKTNKFINFVGKVKAYRYRNVLYQSYKLEKDYYPDYLTSGFGDYIHKDDLDYKDYYSKRMRSVIDITKDNKPLLKSEDTMPPKVSNLVNVLEEKNDTKTEKKLLDNYNSTYKAFRSPLKSEKIDEERIPVWYFVGPILILLSIIILVLSKLYKRKK